MPRFQQITPVLRVADMQRSVEFYTQVLGFGVAWRSADEGDGENCMLRADATSLLLSTGSHLGGTPQFSGTLYFDMQGLDEFYERVKASVDLVWPLETMAYGQREFGIRDCDGYVLAFAQEAGAVDAE